jgi:hypothetical protein
MNLHGVFIGLHILPILFYPINRICNSSLFSCQLIVIHTRMTWSWLKRTSRKFWPNGVNGVTRAADDGGTFRLPVRPSLQLVARNLPGTEFSSKPVLHRRDGLPCCCVPVLPARIFPDIKEIVEGFVGGFDKLVSPNSICHRALCRTWLQFLNSKRGQL